MTPLIEDVKRSSAIIDSFFNAVANHDAKNLAEDEASTCDVRLYLPK